jgi:hypothetical protein
MTYPKKSGVLPELKIRICPKKEHSGFQNYFFISPLGAGTLKDGHSLLLTELQVLEEAMNTRLKNISIFLAAFQTRRVVVVVVVYSN